MLPLIGSPFGKAIVSFWVVSGHTVGDPSRRHAAWSAGEASCTPSGCAKSGLPSFGDRAAQYWLPSSSSTTYGSVAGPVRTKLPAVPPVT